MKTRLVVALGTGLLLLGHAPEAHGVGCPINYTSGVAQFGAGSGHLANPIGLPEECGLSPVSSTESAGPLGGTYWQGTGTGGQGVNSTSYTFTLGSGWWGYSVASMGMFYFPDLIITGGPGPTVSAQVNVQYGGTASGYVPAQQNVKWAVDVLDLAGNTLANSFLDLYYTPNGPVLTATSQLLNNLPVGSPFALQVRTQWYQQGPPFGSGLTTNGDAFLQLLGPQVFALPAGYTLDSASAGIVNNQLVPEPAVAALLLPALALLARRRRR